MGKVDWTLRVSLSVAVAACGGSAFTSAGGDGGDGDGGGSSGGASSGTGGSSGPASSGAGSSGTASSGGSSGSSGTASSGGSASSGASGSGSGSGSTSSGGGNSSSGSGSGGCTGGASCDAGPPSPCPPQVPPSGGACTMSGLACEYGNNPVLGCNVVATCTQSAWAVQIPSASTNCSTTRATGCPLTFAGVPQGTSCTPAGLLCGYPVGRCECAVGGGVVMIVDGAAVASWHCQAPGPSCPMPRPPLGSSCSAPGQSCDYGACYVLGGSAQTCTGGVWTQALFACPAIAGQAN